MSRRDRYDAIIAGAGQNGLTAACYLAKSGQKGLVVERNDWIGRAAVSRSLHPGWIYSNFSYVCSLRRREIVRDFDTPRFGVHVFLKREWRDVHPGRCLAAMGPALPPPASTFSTSTCRFSFIADPQANHRPGRGAGAVRKHPRRPALGRILPQSRRHLAPPDGARPSRPEVLFHTPPCPGSPARRLLTATSAPNGKPQVR